MGNSARWDPKQSKGIKKLAHRKVGGGGSLEFAHRRMEA
jgi:hypothetical protein